MARRFLVLAAALMLIVAACGGGDTAGDGDDGGTDTPVAAGDAARGQDLFVTCAACHGANGEGLEGLGKPMPGSEFIASLSDSELVDFIKAGRSTSDPANTTGVDMPPKGGNPALSDADLLDIVAYIRSLG